MRLTISIIILFAAIVVASAQKFELYYSIGYGQYKMDDLKQLQKDILSQVPFPAKLTDNFPMHINYELGGLIPFANGDQKVGIALGGMSTGCRATVQDYSGSYTVDQVVNGFKIGGIYEVRMFTWSKVDVCFSTDVSYLSSKFKLEERFVLGSNKETDVFEFKSSGICFEPRIKYRLQFHRILLALQTGYFVDASSPLHLKDNQNAELQLDGESIGADFSGFRMNVVLGIKLGKL